VKLRFFKIEIRRELIKLNLFLLPFYFLIYMMFFYDADSDAWSEIDFNRTAEYRTLEELFQIFGEPDKFEDRGKFLVLDYRGLVYKKQNKQNRYPLVRLMILNRKDTVLLPDNIYYKK
jgi:hypothetical protein